MKSSRQKILDELEKREFVTATELSYALHVTSANIRHHLSVLQLEGVIQVAGQLPSSGRGRPTLLYTLTRRSGQHNLGALSSALLKELTGSLSLEEQDGLFRRIAAWLSGSPAPAETTRPAPASTKPVSLTRRLNQTVSRLNADHYQARWEAHADAPRLILGHCPYAALLPEHPELCEIDARLLEDLLHTPIRQAAKRIKDNRGAATCKFIIGKKGKI
jgi:predicted ArsR family transcriptional regulator